MIGSPGAGGIDLALLPAAEGVRDGRVAPSGDLATVAGDDNAVQALTLRLLVRRGELARLGLPDYGSRLHELVGAPNSAAVRLRLAAHAREALAADPRVLDVEARVTPDRVQALLRLQVVLVDVPGPLQVEVTVPLGAP